jgi:uncharacterized protein YndB with AHSA1/START domain
MSVSKEAEMETRPRWAASLAMTGGALFVVVLVIVASSPTSPVWYGFLVGIVLLGAAVVGLYWQTRPATGRLGWASAWLSGLGTIALVVFAAYAAATGEIATLQAENPPMSPVLALGIGASTAWLVGNLGFAVALLRSRTLSRLGAWLVLAGAFVAVATAPLAGSTTAQGITLVSTLLFGLMPFGWVVIGYAAWRRLSTRDGPPGAAHMSHSVRASVKQFVRAPIERVYAAYVDPAVLRRWMGIQAITAVSGPLDRPGTTFTEVVFGPYRPRDEVLAAEPPTLHDMTGRTFLGLGYRWTTHFAEKDGGTEVTLDAEAILPGLVGRLFGRTLAGGAMGRRTQRRLAAFADLVEAREVRTMARTPGRTAAGGGGGRG